MIAAKFKNGFDMLHMSIHHDLLALSLVTLLQNEQLSLL